VHGDDEIGVGLPCAFDLCKDAPSNSIRERGMHHTVRGRRDVLKVAGAIAMGTLFGASRAIASRPRDGALTLYSIHTGEQAVVEYCAGGSYRPDALQTVNRLLRDHRTDEVHAIDPSLLDQLYALRRQLGTRAPYHVVCGYRSPETNARKLEEGRAVALHSLHLEGRAVDVFLPDRELHQLHAAALKLAAGGVGYYPRDGFVHVDTGAPRTW
jgi:uncharacterized protein YcbK (DUF882 family)